jgi:hypothetical protein
MPIFSQLQKIVPVDYKLSHHNILYRHQLPFNLIQKNCKAIMLSNDQSQNVLS